jgi:hypothetical protein
MCTPKAGVRAYLALKGCCDVHEEALLADRVGAKQEEAPRVEQLSLREHQHHHHTSAAQTNTRVHYA